MNFSTGLIALLAATPGFVYITFPPTYLANPLTRALALALPSPAGVL